MHIHPRKLLLYNPLPPCFYSRRKLRLTRRFRTTKKTPITRLGRNIKTSLQVASRLFIELTV